MCANLAWQTEVAFRWGALSWGIVGNQVGRTALGYRNLVAINPPALPHWGQCSPSAQLDGMGDNKVFVARGSGT